MKYWDKILGILLITLMVVMVSGCLSANEETGDGFVVTNVNMTLGEGYTYTFDSGHTCTISVVDIGYGFDSIRELGVSSKYCVPTVESEGKVLFEISGTKVGGITDMGSCTTEEVNKAITDVLNKQNIK